jgi:hypothetical protein
MTSSAGGRTAAVLAAIAVGQAVLVGGIVPGVVIPAARDEPHRSATWRGATTGEPPEPDAY